MPLHGLKRRLFRLTGPAAYRLLHAAWFRLRLSRALASRAYARRFFGDDLLAFAARIRPGDIVLDIGAFLGGSTALFSRAVGRSGTVIAFEPVHHRWLLRLLRSLRMPQAGVRALALAAANGDAELVIPIREGVPLYSQAGFSQSYAEAARPGSGYAFERLPTDLMRLDDFLAREGMRPETVAAVKIDVEGSELSVFGGGEGFFRDFRGILLCEFWFRAMPPPGWAWLRERGYSCRYLDRKGTWVQADTPEALSAACRGETYGNFFWEKPAAPGSIPPE